MKLCPIAANIGMIGVSQTSKMLKFERLPSPGVVARMEEAMDMTGKDAPTTDETAEMVELEKIVRAKDGKPEDGPSPPPNDTPSEN